MLSGTQERCAMELLTEASGICGHYGAEVRNPHAITVYAKGPRVKDMT